VTKSAYSAHVDTFARERLPPRAQWPEFIYELPELRFPDRVNCAARLIDDAVREGHGNRIAICADDGNATYGLLRDRANRIANLLVHELGVVPGNRVLLRFPNNATMTAAWLGVVKAGAIAVSTMPMLRAKELAFIAEIGTIDHALCDPRLAGELEVAARNTGRLRNFRQLGPDLDAQIAQHSAEFTNCDTASEDVCLLAFTSGTTGRPKATMHFHRDVLAVAEVIGRYLVHTSPDDVYCGSPPLGFTFGLGALLVLPLAYRACVAFVEQPTPDSLLSAVQRHRVTCLFTAPKMYANLSKLIGRYDLSSLRRCVSAGEALPKTISEAWHEATGIRIIDGIGSTEMLHIFIGSEGQAIRPGATGKPLPGYRACVVDDHLNPMPAGQIGWLAVKGPTGCRYLEDPRQTDYVRNGWNITGDKYLVDEDGYFWFQARADDMIISSGYNIAGPEVEAALATHPAVAECAVVASPDPERGHIVKAFVIVESTHVASPKLARELQEHVKASIAPYKYPRAVEFVSSLPKTPTGKVQRSTLREIEQLNIR
jgi:2-aminobenzoate-CoA ligase